MKIALLTASTISHNDWGLPVYDELTRLPENSIFSSMGFWSLCFAVLAILMAIGVSYLVDKKYYWLEKIAKKYLTYAFVFVWIFGFMVYDIGMYTGEPASLLGNSPMAIIHAFEIFLLQSDVSAVHGALHNNWWYMSAFSMAHFLAALVSLVFVLKHFGYNMMAAVRRWLMVRKKETAYIFWGMNDATYYMAKDINKCAQQIGDYNLVIVRTNNDTNASTSKNGMERLFNFLSMNSEDFNRLSELNCFMTNADLNLSTLSVDATASVEPAEILRKELRLTSLCRIISKKTMKDLHIFFLSDDEEANIQAVANLIKDKAVQDFAPNRKVVFYCHARYNSIHRVIEDELTSDNIEVKVVDSSRTSVELLKKKPEFHPVQYVKVEQDATVSSAFNALVIGFSEVGLDFVRFLYEFGAFVKSGEARVKRSDFCCHVIDQNMDNLAGVFTVNAPSIETTLNREEDEEAKMINLYKMDCRSEAFYKRLRRWIETLNYIVIATGDDETNISMAVRIFRLAIRYRKNALENFRILVRVQHDENGHVQKIAEHYNRLWAAEQESTGEEKKLKQKVIRTNESVVAPITLFGAVSDVYMYEHIVSESLKEDAKAFKEKYDKSVNELREISGEEPYTIEDWDEEQRLAMQLTKEYKGYSPTYSGIMRLRRTQSQNIANSLHRETKILLAKKALGSGGYNDIVSHGMIRKALALTYTWKDHCDLPIEPYQKVLDMLARTEHLRWNASHELLGYQMGVDDDDSKDEARLTHGCLKDWEKLKDATKSYDYNVVDVSLNLIDINQNEVKIMSNQP